MPRRKVGPVALYYESTGAGDAVVLVHGLGSHVGDRKPQVDALSDTFRMITVDLRGHQRSESAAHEMQLVFEGTGRRRRTGADVLTLYIHHCMLDVCEREIEDGKHRNQSEGR